MARAGRPAGCAPGRDGAQNFGDVWSRDQEGSQGDKGRCMMTEASGRSVACQPASGTGVLLAKPRGPYASGLTLAEVSFLLTLSFLNAGKRAKSHTTTHSKQQQDSSPSMLAECPGQAVPILCAQLGEGGNLHRRIEVGGPPAGLRAAHCAFDAANALTRHPGKGNPVNPPGNSGFLPSGGDGTFFSDMVVLVAGMRGWCVLINVVMLGSWLGTQNPF